MIKIARQIRRKPDPGQFSLDGPELDWVACRENFSKIWNQNHKGLFFSHEPGYQKRICSFIHKTEEIIIKGALQNIENSNFYETNFNFATWIEPSAFWMNCSMKRSLFTMLLRCGIFYENDYEKALFSIDYSKSTKKALQRFLYGFTEISSKEDFIGVGKGWVSYFANKDLNHICKKLANPNKVRIQSFLFGEEILWI